jgi:ATP-dependent DNA ligase
LHSAAFASCLGLIGAQKAQRDKAKELYRLLGLLNTTELPPAIYLYQGRLAQMYRSRQTNHVPRVWVHSQVVVDVTVAEKTRDGRYKHAGYRLFRKRGIRIRDDLKIEDVYNLLELEALPISLGQ